MSRSTSIVAVLAIVTVAGAIAWIASTDSTQTVDSLARSAASPSTVNETGRAQPTTTRDPSPSTSSTRTPSVSDDAPVATTAGERSLTLTAFCERINSFAELDPARVILRGLASGPVDGVKARTDQEFIWSDLPDGAYSIEIDDPRYARWTMSDLAPDASVEALLIGECAVAVTIVAAETGTPMPAYRLRGSYRHPESASTDFRLREEREPAPEGGVYTGLIPGDLTLIADADGFAASEVTLSQLSAHATRSCTIVLKRDTQVRGVVVMPDGSTPVADAIVRLRPPMTEDVDAFPEVLRDPSVHHPTLTDAHGRFTIANVEPGEYELFAEVNAHLATPRVHVALAAGEVADETLVLPVSGGVRGKLLWKCEVPPNGLRVAARRSRGASPLPSTIVDFVPFPGRRPVVSSVADDGSFLLEPLPAGPVDIVFELLGASVKYLNGSGSRGPSEYRFVGTAMVRAGEIVDAVFDLGVEHPGFVRASVEMPGSTPEGVGMRAFLCTVDETGAPRSDLKGSATFDEKGDALLGPLPPGRYEIRIVPFDVSLDAPVELRPATVASLRQVFETHRGTIVVVDEHDVPRPNAAIYFCTQEFVGPILNADAEGRIEFQFPRFRGEIRYARTRVKPSHTDSKQGCYWPPTDGELRVTLEN